MTSTADLRNLASTLKHFIAKNSEEQGYFDNLTIDLKKNFNESLGLANKNNGTSIIYEYNPDDIVFNQGHFQNFWDDKNNPTSSNIKINSITNFFAIDLRDRMQIKNYYPEFLNPYTGFVIDTLVNVFGIDLTKIKDNKTVFANLYLFLNGDGTYGGTRGSGTLKLCQMCNKNWGTSPYDKLSKNPDMQSFCGCCHQLHNYTNSGIYKEIKKTDIPELPCQPVCHKYNVIKPYVGASIAVNNGYPNNVFPGTSGNMNYERRVCNDQTICIIDNPNVTMIGGQNTVLFNQICPQCSNGRCTCYLDTTESNIDVVSSGINGLQNNLIFKQNCPISYCYTRSAAGESKLSICNPNNTSDSGKNPDQDYDHSGNISNIVTNDTRNRAIYGLKNLSVNFYFLLVLIFIILGFLAIDIKKDIIYVKKQNKQDQ